MSTIPPSYPESQPSYTYSAPVPPDPNPWGPFTAGDVIRRTFQLYRHNAGTAIAISALATAIVLVPQVVYDAFQMVFQTPAQSPPDLHRALILLPFALIFFVVLFLATAASYAMAGGGMFNMVLTERRGERAGVESSIKVTFARFGDAIGATLLVWLRMFCWCILGGFVFGIGLAIIGAIAGVSAMGKSSSPNAGAAAALGLLFAVFAIVAVILMLVFLFWIGARYFVTLGALYAEGIRAGDSVRRSIALTRHNKGRILALLFFVFALGIAVEMVFAMPVIIYFVRHAGQGALASANLLQTRKFMFITQGATLVFVAFFNSLLYFPLMGIGMTLCYFDLRARAEAIPPPPPLDPAPYGHPVLPVAPVEPGAPVASAEPATPSPAGGWPIAPVQTNMPSGDYGPYLSARYDAPRSYRMDPGPAKPVVEPPAPESPAPVQEPTIQEPPIQDPPHQDPPREDPPKQEPPHEEPRHE